MTDALRRSRLTLVAFALRSILADGIKNVFISHRQECRTIYAMLFTWILDSPAAAKLSCTARSGACACGRCNVRTERVNNRNIYVGHAGFLPPVRVFCLHSVCACPCALQARMRLRSGACRLRIAYRDCLFRSDPSQNDPARTRTVLTSQGSMQRKDTSVAPTRKTDGQIFDAALSFLDGGDGSDAAKRLGVSGLLVGVRTRAGALERVCVHRLHLFFH